MVNMRLEAEEGIKPSRRFQIDSNDPEDTITGKDDMELGKEIDPDENYVLE